MSKRTVEIEARAERLRVGMLWWGLVREPSRDALKAGASLIGSVGYEELCAGDEEDVALINACLGAEWELRNRHWRALEQLLAAIPPGGSYEEVVYLPRQRALPALRALATLRWLGDGPEEGD